MSTMASAGCVGSAALLALLVAAGPAGAVVGTEHVSRATGFTGVAANAGTDSVTTPQASTNGRYVAFQSRATNLDPADTDDVPDIYVRDTQTGTTTLVSRATGAGAKGNGKSDYPAISADGRFVVFASASSNLAAPDADTLGDVFIRDLANNTTTLIARGTPGDNFATTPGISADGRYVAFNSQNQIHVLDRQTSTTTRVDLSTGGAAGSSNSFSPSISPNGRYVAFESQSTNLDPADTSPDTDIYVRDTVANTTVLASRAGGAAGAKASTSSGRPSMSDLPSVAFDTAATNLDPADTGPSDFDIFVRDLTANTTTLASRASGAGGAAGDNSSTEPSISANGQRVAFQSFATNLAAPDTTGGTDIFVRDLGAATTSVASVATSGEKANNNTRLPGLSPDGGFVAFESAASNLGVTANASQIYIRNLASVPTGGGSGGGGGASGGTSGGTGGGGTSGGGLGSIAPARAGFGTSKRSIKVGRRGTFSFSFRAGPTLKGRATFKSAKKLRIAGRKRTVTLVSKPFTVPSSGNVKLQLRLSSANLRILRRARSIKTNVTVKLTNAAGLSSTARLSVTLKR